MLEYRTQAHTYFVNNDFAGGMAFFAEESRLQLLDEEWEKHVLCFLFYLRFKILKGENVREIHGRIEQLKDKFPTVFAEEQNWYNAYAKALINDADYFLGDDYKLQHSPDQHDLIEILRRFGDSDHYLYFIDYIQANYTMAKFEWRARSIACAVDRFVRLFSEIHRYPDDEGRLDFLLIKGYNLMGILLMDTRGFETGREFMKMAEALLANGCTLHKDHVHRATLELDIAHCELKLLGERERSGKVEEGQKTKKLSEVRTLLDNAKKKLDLVYAGKPHRYYAHYLRIEALYYREKDRDPRRAIDRLEDSYLTREKSFSQRKQGHPSMSRIRNYQAHLILNKQVFSETDYLEALQYAKKAVVTACRNDHPSGKLEINSSTGIPTIGSSNDLFFQTCMMRALHTKALIHLKRYRSMGDDRDDALLKLAYQSLLQAGKAISNTNRFLLDSASKYLLAEQTRPVFEAATAITYYLSKQKQTPAIKKFFNQVYLLVQRCKSNLLLQELGSIPIKVNTGGQDDNGKSQLVDYSLRRFSKRVLEDLQSTEKGNDAAALDRIEQQHKHWSNLVEPQHFCRNKHTRQPTNVPESIPVDKIIDGLEDDDAAFFSYTLTPKRCYGTLISRAVTKTILLVDGHQQVKALKELIGQFKLTVQRTGIDKPVLDFDDEGPFQLHYEDGRDPEATRLKFIEQARQLYELLFSKLVDAAGNPLSRIYVLPDAELWGTYFNALLNRAVDPAIIRKSPTSYQDLPFLIKEYLITVHFSVPIINSVYQFPNYNKHELQRNRLNNAFVQGSLQHESVERASIAQLHRDTNFFEDKACFVADNWNWNDWCEQMKINRDTLMIYAHGSNGHNNLATIGFNRSLDINVIDLYRFFKSRCHLLILLSCYGNKGPLLMGEAYLSPVYSIFRRNNAMNIIYVDDVIKPAKLIKVVVYFLNNLSAYRELSRFVELEDNKQYLADALRSASLKVIEEEDSVPAEWAPIFFLGNQRSHI